MNIAGSALAPWAHSVRPYGDGGRETGGGRSGDRPYGDEGNGFFGFAQNDGIDTHEHRRGRSRTVGALIFL